jgi:hypothetical protein
MRIIELFSKGEWTINRVLNIPDDVELFHEIVCDSEKGSSSRSSPLLTSSRQLSRPVTAHVTPRRGSPPQVTPPGLKSLEKNDIENIGNLTSRRHSSLASARSTARKLSEAIRPIKIVQVELPKISFMRVIIDNLEPNTIYEFRFSYRNESGFSDYSLPSQRAKTNKADTPQQPMVPKILQYSNRNINMELIIPYPGGAPIHQIDIEMQDVDRLIFSTESFSYNSLILDENNCKTTVTINDLRPGTFYLFRMRAVNRVGPGNFSEWTDEIQMHPDEE